MQSGIILHEAYKALSRNKIRSALTVLGITIGIAAVICVVAMGEAGSRQYQEQLHNLGDNMVWVEAGGRTINGVRTGANSTKTLTVADANAILTEIPLIKKVSPQVDGNVQLVYQNQNWYTRYAGESPEYIEIRRWAIVSGVNITDDDVGRAAEVCVLGDTVREQLFNEEDPIGKYIKVKDFPCKVVGTLSNKGNSVTGQDQDDFILIPYTTAQKKIAGITWLKDIMCSAVTPEAVPVATQQIVLLMRERHRIGADAIDDFNIRTPEEIIKAGLEASRTFTALLVSIASVALLVGGIGIMNVMLVSVTERTREIGIRLAIGATETDVQTQFLGEAIVLSAFGGLCGIALGIIGSFLLGSTLRWPMSIPPTAIAVATAFAIAVGVFFGFYPARKAASLDPIEALRYE